MVMFSVTAHESTIGYRSLKAKLNVVNYLCQLNVVNYLCYYIEYYDKFGP